MSSSKATQDVHIVLAAMAFYGHVRPLLSLAKSLLALGYSVTFITGSAFRELIDAIAGLEFVPLKGKADFDPNNLNEEFPGRGGHVGQEQIFFDHKNIFFGTLQEQCSTIQEVLTREDLKDKKVVMVSDGGFPGTLPMLLDSPHVRRVPSIGIGHFPLLVHSRDSAPFGTGLPSQGEEKNLDLSAAVTEAFSGVQSVTRGLLEPYECTKEFPSEFSGDYIVILQDIYCQLCVPALEPHRRDLPSNVRFCGTLSGSNSTRPLPEWFQEFVVEDTTDHPLMVVTSGTLTDRKLEELILPTVEACKDLSVRLVVCAVNISKPDGLELPANARWAQWIAFEELFPYTSVFISNAGYGGVSQALAAGIPLILAGTTEEKADVSLRAEVTGAALNLRTQTPSAEVLEQSMRKILEDPTYREKAQEIKQSYAECDAVGSIVGAIEELASKFY